MTNTKISALTSATTPLVGTEVLPVVQSSATTKVTVANITAGRSVSAADYVMSTGNLVPSTANKGINFTANTPAAGMTSQLFNKYEEGVWAPNQGGGLTVVGAFSSSGAYTRIGRFVIVTGRLNGATSISATAGSPGITTNLPFTALAPAGGVAYNVLVNSGSVAAASGTSVFCTATIGVTTVIYFSVTYMI